MVSFQFVFDNCQSVIKKTFITSIKFSVILHWLPFDYDQNSLCTISYLYIFCIYNFSIKTSLENTPAKKCTNICNTVFSFFYITIKK